MFNTFTYHLINCMCGARLRSKPTHASRAGTGWLVSRVFGCLFYNGLCTSCTQLIVSNDCRLEADVTFPILNKCFTAHFDEHAVAIFSIAVKTAFVKITVGWHLMCTSISWWIVQMRDSSMRGTLTVGSTATRCYAHTWRPCPCLQPLRHCPMYCSPFE